MSDSKKIILVVGGTGRTGQAVVRRLLTQTPTPEVRVLTRNVESAQKLLGGDVRIFQGNVAQLDAVARALADVTHVFYLTGPAIFDSRLAVEQCIVWGLRNIINESKKTNKLKHILLLTSVAVETPYRIPSVIINKILCPGLMSDHVIQERILRESGIDYTILRPPMLGSQDVAPEEVDVSRTDAKGMSVSRAALGEVFVRAMTNPALPRNVTFYVWGRKEKLTDRFDWNKLFSKLEPDFDDLPKDLEKRHATAGIVYSVSLALVVVGSGLLLYRKYAH